MVLSFFGGIWVLDKRFKQKEGRQVYFFFWLDEFGCKVIILDLIISFGSNVYVYCVEGILVGESDQLSLLLVYMLLDLEFGGVGGEGYWGGMVC